VMFSDWLQGPSVYALYASYNYSKEDIALLFVTGYGSSAIFGTFVGSLAVKFGRKKLCITFGIIYAIACLIKTVNNFPLLMLGRVLGGIATSLLFSVFEAWMVYEHNARGFDSAWLSNTFGISIVGNGLVAIVAGVVASFLSSQFGYISPFILSMVILVVTTVLIQWQWTENYGNKEVEWKNLFSKAISTLQNDKRIALLGMVQSLFEASMYIFVFMWTPVLEELVKEFTIPSYGLHGIVFSVFMVCIMLGSSCFSIFVKRYEPENILSFILFIALLNFFMIGAFISNTYIVINGFLMFELCVGVYFPTIGTIRSKYIPEEARAAVMNIFRIPLNVLVVLILKYINMFENKSIFYICSVLLLIAFIMQYLIVKKYNKVVTTTPNINIVDNEVEVV